VTDLLSVDLTRGSVTREPLSADLEPLGGHGLTSAIVNQDVHPEADGAKVGEGSLRDFELFCGVIKELNDGGVYCNVGSAVLLPEVFLKAITLVRNLGHPLRGFTTVDLDFLRQYRPTENVVRRPTAEGGMGFRLTGHHEIMVPLLAAALLERLGAAAD